MAVLNNSKKTATSKKKFPQDFIKGLLLGFLITIYVLFILKPMLMPTEAVAPTNNSKYIRNY